jgi:hypothetical protein
MALLVPVSDGPSQLHPYSGMISHVTMQDGVQKDNLQQGYIIQISSIAPIGTSAGLHEPERKPITEVACQTQLYVGTCVFARHA